MAAESTHIDITNMRELRNLAEAVERSQAPCILVSDGEQLAMVVPVDRAHDSVPTKRPPRLKAFTRDDALFGLIGIGEGKTPGGVSGHKHEALARAYRPK